MSDVTANVSSEVRELLREAADEPGSVLFSRPPQSTPRHPFGSPLDRPVAWSRVERHLIDRHATEFAFLLRSQWLLKLSNAGPDSYRLFLRRGVHDPVVVPQQHDLERSWVEWREWTPSGTLPEPPPLTLDATGLARLAVEVHPSPARWVDLALSRLTAGAYTDAADLLERAARLRPDHRTASCILANQGLLLSMGGQSAGALAAYREASRLWPDHMSALVSRLVLSWSCGSVAEALEAGLRLNAVAPEGAAAVDEQVEYCRRLIREGKMSTDQKMRTMASKVADRVGGAAGRISSVLE